MRTDFEQRAKQMTTRRKLHKTWMKVVSTLAAITVFCTTYALILPAITISANTYCGHEEHEHTDACYERQLVCGLEEGDDVVTTEEVLVDAGHVHTEECYEVETVLTCDKEEVEAKEEVIDEETGEVIEEAVEGHTHTEECYEEVEELTCGEEEREATYETKETVEEAHKHTDECYEDVLVCGMEEHKHVDECFANKDADLETKDMWEDTLPEEEEMKNEWREDTLLIAQSQVGYKESEVNFIVQEGERKGYTRYGAWYGAPYSDWCAMFLQFSMHYAGVSTAYMKGDASVPRWVKAEVEKENFFKPEDYTPQAGDIIFFDWDDDNSANHVGIVEEVKLNENGDAVQIVTIEGNSSNSVKRNTYKADDEYIYGYSIIPERPRTEEEIAAKEAEEAAAAEEANDAIQMEATTDTNVVVTFSAPKEALPEGVDVDNIALKVSEIEEGTEEYEKYKAAAESQVASDEDVEMATARFFDISIVDAEGNEVKLSDESLASVSIVFPEVETIKEHSNLDVVHFGEESTEVLQNDATIENENLESVTFETPGFSVFGVVSTVSVSAKYITASGTIYEVTVSYGPEAELPDDAKLSITEYEKDSAAYQEVVDLIDYDSGAHNDVLDISIVDSEGNKLEPASPVTVDIVVLNPEDNVEVFGNELQITHIKEEGGELIPEVVDIKSTETLQVAEDIETVVTKAVQFEVEGFSSYALSWGSNDENKKTHTRIFYGYERDTMFMEFPQNSGTPNNGPTGNSFNLAAAYAGVEPYGTSGSPSFYYVTPATSILGLFRDSNHTPSYVGVSIGSELRFHNNKWQFYATGNWRDNTNPSKPVDRGPGWYDIADQSEIYVKYPYDPQFNVAIEDPNKRGGDDYVPLSESADNLEDLGEPAHAKTKTSNGDGTYTLALNVSGKEASSQASTKADIIIIYDTSGSTGNFDQYKIDGKYRWQVMKPAVDKLIDELMSNNNYVEDSVRMGLITFADHGAVHYTIEDNPTAEQMKSGIPTWGSGRTNWEDAWLQLAKIKTRADAKQYVLFITDGDPTLRNTAAPPVFREYVVQKEGGGPFIEIDGQKAFSMKKVYSSNNHNGFYFLDVNNVMGTGKNVKYNVPEQWNHTEYGVGPYGYSVEGGYDYQMRNNMYAASDTVATAGNGSGNVTNIGIGAFLNGNSKGRLQDLIGHVGGEAHFAYNYDDFMNIFTPLIEEISSNVHYENVKITDGITKHAAHRLANGGNFQYYRYGGKYGDPWAIAGAEYAGKSFQELPASVKGRFAWTGAPAATYIPTNTAEESGKVEWDLSSVPVEGGVTYEVAFQVWPDQFSLDTVADTLNELPANNSTGAHPYDSLSQADKNQINRDGNDFSVETNTDAKIDYKEVKVHGGTTTTKEGSADYNRVDPMPLDVMEIDVKKDWFNDENTQQWKAAYEADGRSIDFNFIEDNKVQKTLTLNGANDWTTKVYVAPGHMVRDSYVIKNGNTKVYEVKYANNTSGYTMPDGSSVGYYYELESGHRYTFSELANNTDFEFTPKTYNAKLVYPAVNSTPKTVIDAPNGRWKLLGETVTGYVLGTNRASGGTNGELALNKKVFNAQNTELSSTDTFSVNVKLVDGNNNGFDGLTYVIMENGQVVKGEVDGHPSVSNDTTGERPVTSNTKDGHSFNLKTSQTIVIKGIPSGAHYTVSENDIAGYLLTGYTNNGTNVVTNRQNDTGMEVEGDIATGRTSVTVKNEKRVALQIEKTVTNQAGKPVDSNQVFWVNAKITNASGRGYNYSGNNSAGGGVTYNIYDESGNKITTHIDGHADIQDGEDFRRPGPISGTGGLTNTLRFPITTGYTVVFNGIPTNATWEVAEDTSAMGAYRIESYNVNGNTVTITPSTQNKVSGDFSSTSSSGTTTEQGIWKGPYNNFDNDGIYLIYNQSLNSYLGVNTSGALTLIPERSGTTYHEMLASYNNGAVEMDAALKRVAWQTEAAAGGTKLKSVATGKWIQYSFGSWGGDTAQLTMGDNSSYSNTMIWYSSNGNLGGKIYGVNDYRTFYIVRGSNNTLQLSACSAMPFQFYKLQANAIASGGESVSVGINNTEKPTTLEIGKSVEGFRNANQSLAYGDDQLFWFEVSITHNGGGLSTADDGITYDLMDTEVWPGLGAVKVENGEDVRDANGNLIHGSVVEGANGAFDNSFRDVEQLCLNAGHSKTDLMLIPLKRGQSVHFQGIPEGATWTVKEVNIDSKYNFVGFKKNDGDLTEDNFESGVTAGNTKVEAVNKEVPTSIELTKDTLDVTGKIDNSGDDNFWFKGAILDNGGNGYTYNNHSVYYYLLDREGNIFTGEMQGHQNPTVQDEEGVRGRVVSNTSNIELPIKAGWTIKFMNIPIGARWKFKEKTDNMPADYKFKEYTVGSEVRTDLDAQGFVSDTAGKNNTYVAARNQLRRSELVVGKLLYDYGHSRISSDDTWFTVNIKVLDSTGNGLPAYNAETNAKRTYILYNNGNVYKDSIDGHADVIDQETGERPIQGSMGGNGAPFQLKQGMYVRIMNLPIGGTWSVSEPSVPDGYQLEGYVMPNEPLDSTNKNHINEASGTIAEGQVNVDVHNKKTLSPVTLKKENMAGRALKGAEFKLFDARLVSDSTWVNVFERNMNLLDHDGARAAGGIKTPNLGGEWGYGSTKLGENGYTNNSKPEGNTNVGDSGNAANLYIRPDGYLVKNSNRNELLKNSNGNDIRYLPITVTTDGDGIADLGLLPPGTYILRETKAPDGYEALSEDVTIYVHEDGTVTSAGNVGDTYSNDGGSHVVTVKNSSGTELPETGGVGTTIITIMGLILMIGATLLLAAKRVAVKARPRRTRR